MLMLSELRLSQNWSNQVQPRQVLCAGTVVGGVVLCLYAVQRQTDNWLL